MVLRLFLLFQTLHLFSSQEWGGAKDESYANWACWFLLNWWYNKFLGFSGGTVVKSPPVTAGDRETEVWSLGQEDPLEEDMATRSSILGWRIPQTGAWWATVHGVKKSWTWLNHWACACARAHTHTHTQNNFLGISTLCGSASKESSCNAGDPGSIPGLGRSPGEGKGYLLQYSGLEKIQIYMRIYRSLYSPWDHKESDTHRVRHDWLTFTFTTYWIPITFFVGQNYVTWPTPSVRNQMFWSFFLS